MKWRRDSHTVLIVPGGSAADGLYSGFLLDHEQIQVLTRRDSQQAWEVARADSPELIVIDLAGGDSHVELAQKIKQDPATASVPLVLIVPAESIDSAAGLDAEALLGSPFEQADYFQAIARFLPLPQRRESRHCVNLRFRYVQGASTGQAFSRDLSAFGAFLKTDRILVPGTRIEVQFQLPGHPDEIHCGAVVHRAARFEGDSHRSSGFAVEFADIEPSDRERLRRFIEERSRNSVFSW
jgi:hypothetical protein